MRPFALFSAATHTAERMACLYKNAVMFCHVTRTYKQQYAPATWRTWGQRLYLLFHQQSRLLSGRDSGQAPPARLSCCVKQRPGSGKQVRFENTYWSLIWLCPFLWRGSLLCPSNYGRKVQRSGYVSPARKSERFSIRSSNDSNNWRQRTNRKQHRGKDAQLGDIIIDTYI